MSSGGNSSSRPTRTSSSRRTNLAISQDQPPQNSLYTRVAKAKEAANAILQDTSNWPQDLAIAVKELLEAINNAPHLNNIPFESTGIPGELETSMEQFALAMEDVCARLKQTHRKYGSNREIADMIKYPFSPRNKDRCETALRGCRNNIDKALAALRDYLPDDPVTQYLATGPSDNQVQPDLTPARRRARLEIRQDNG